MLKSSDSLIKNGLIQTTLCFLLKDEEILLAEKKHGFGIGKLNGIGGKQQPGETIAQAAIREVEEEIKVQVQDLTKVALVDFFCKKYPETDARVHIYTASLWQGQPQETEEMKPFWYPKNKIPYEQMWSDDYLWLPRVIAGERIKATFWFEDFAKINDYQLTKVKEL